MVAESRQFVVGYEGEINAHYGRSELDARILAAFRDAGVDVDTLCKS